MKGIICNRLNLAAVAWLAVLPVGAQSPRDNSPAAKQAALIPMDQLGAVAGKQYQGDGLSVAATPDGARLRCAFQRLEGEVTRDGLWLRSTAGEAQGERFRVMAVEVGRQSSDGSAAVCEAPAAAWSDCFTRCGWVCDHSRAPLESTGSVLANGQTVRFLRPGLTEEYSVSVDGVRQDFIVEQRPAGDGELRVELAVTGAKPEPLASGARPVRYPARGTATEQREMLSHGARLVLDGSGRKLAYNRLRVTDATGRELPARMEVAAGVSPAVEGGSLPPGSGARTTEVSSFHCDEFASSGFSAGLEATALRQAEMPAATTLAVVVDDAAAIYPVRIDPTFSDADWISMGGIPGVDGTVNAAVVDDISNLYIGGEFTIAGDVRANRVAKWNGSAWSALGSGLGGISYPNVLTLALSGTNLYAGGVFTTAGGNPATNIAKWDGNVWSGLGPGMNNYVRALALSGTNLYAGGDFTTAGGVNVSGIAKWDGVLWSPLGIGLGGVPTPVVYALAVSGTNLYAGGYFTTADGNPANRIAKWDGFAWSALGSGIGSYFGYVGALTVAGTNLFAAGTFDTAGEIAANNIARWNGSTWSALGPGVGSYVHALAASGTYIYAGVDLTTAGGTSANWIARWNGIEWSNLDSGVNGQVLTLAVSGSNLFAGGFFHTASGKAASRIATWNGITWSALGTGLGGVQFPSVYALVLSGSNLYVGGHFTMVGGTAVNGIAEWNGSTWSALGAGMNSTVSALAASGTNLYAGGGFTTAGGIIANRIAKWNGIAWSALGSGIGSYFGYVGALTVAGTNLYAAGTFDTAGEIAANNIARWNGSTWSALGSGVGSYVHALAASGTDLYAGGEFTAAGGMVANCVAKWNGNAWSPLGSGMSEGIEVTEVRALVTSGPVLFAGGDFTTAGGAAATNIAKWDGSTWSALGSGMDSGVLALAVSGTDLYAGGWFSMAGGMPANSIAKWNGSSWSSLGSGMNKYVYAIATSGNELHAGGDFTFAGNKISPYVAQANIGAARGSFSNVSYSPATGFSCTFLDASVGQPYRIQTSPSLAVGPWTDLTNFIYASPIVITDASAVSATNTFYRAVTP